MESLSDEEASAAPPMAALLNRLELATAARSPACSGGILLDRGEEGGRRDGYANAGRWKGELSLYGT